MMMTVFSKLTFVCNHSYNHSTIASRLLRLRYCKSNIDQFLFMTCLCVHPRERERERTIWQSSPTENCKINLFCAQLQQKFQLCNYYICLLLKNDKLCKKMKLMFSRYYWLDILKESIAPGKGSITIRLTSYLTGLYLTK